MTLRSRTRKRGTTKFHSESSKQYELPGGTIQVHNLMYIYTTGEGGSIVGLQDQHIYDPRLGLDFRLFDLAKKPPVTLNSRGEAFFSPDQDYLDYVHGFLREQISIPLSPDVPDPISFVVSDTLETMTDVVGSRFQSKKGKEFVVNPMTQSRNLMQAPVPGSGLPPDVEITVYTGSKGRWYTYIQVYVAVTESSTGVPLGLPVAMYNNLLDLARPAQAVEANSTFANAYAKVQSAELELLVVMAESAKTINYLYSKLRTIADYLSGAKRALRKLSWDDFLDYWLEVRYAIRPIIYDVQNTLKVLESDQLDVVRTFRAFDSQQSDEAFLLTHVEGGFKFVLDGHIYQNFDMTAGCYGRLKFDQAYVHKLGLLNFAQTAWEVVPYSFVIDWFINVSGLLASINPNPIYSVETGWKSSKRRYIASGILTVERIDDPSASKSGNVFLNRVTYDRAIATDPVLINFDLNLTVPKLVDLIALARRFL